MRFSIRDLFAVALLAALAMLAWRTNQDARRQQLQLMEVLAEMAQVKQGLRTDDPLLHQAMMAPLDQYPKLHASREIAELQFQKLLEKYLIIESRGPGIVSIRGLPTLQSDSGITPFSFRIEVPEDRPVWLKFGVHPTKRNVQSGGVPDDDKLLRSSPFDLSGPFEIRLPPGIHMVAVVRQNSYRDSLPFRITMNSQTLLETAFRAADAKGSGSSSISAPEQIDFDRKRNLPFLGSINVSMGDQSGIGSTDSYGFTLWLSNASSNFDAFPIRDGQGKHGSNDE